MGSIAIISIDSSYMPFKHSDEKEACSSNIIRILLTGMSTTNRLRAPTFNKDEMEVLVNEVLHHQGSLFGGHDVLVSGIRTISLKYEWLYCGRCDTMWYGSREKSRHIPTMNAYKVCVTNIQVMVGCLNIICKHYI